jgi:hypothetical protein
VAAVHDVGDAQRFALRTEHLEHGAVRELACALAGEREGVVRHLFGPELDHHVPNAVATQNVCGSRMPLTEWWRP